MAAKTEPEPTPKAKKPAPVPRRFMEFDQAVADTICERIATSTRSLRTICADEEMPSVATVLKWLSLYPNFTAQYATAKELQIEALMDETLDIADDGTNDYMMRQNYDGAEIGWHVNGEAMARSRLRIDTRKWMAAHLKPKKYGEKLDIEQKTTLEASDPLLSMLERIAGSGKRLVGSKNVSPSADASPAGRNEIASKAVDDGDD